MRTGRRCHTRVVWCGIVCHADAVGVLTCYRTLELANRERFTQHLSTFRNTVRSFIKF